MTVNRSSIVKCHLPLSPDWSDASLCNGCVGFPDPGLTGCSTGNETSIDLEAACGKEYFDVTEISALDQR